MRRATLATLLLGACTRAPPAHTDSFVTVFAAASLGATLDALKSEFVAARPGVEVRVELSASELACAKIADQGREADLVMSADYDIIDRQLVPEHADFNLLFAHNALVIAYRHDTPVGTALAAGTPWQQVLAAPDARVGIANPALAPVGYRALLALALNDRFAPEDLRLGAVIKDHLHPRHQRPDATKLIAPVEAGDIDAAFVYRTEAAAAGLRYVALDPRIDFSDPALASDYALAEIEITGAAGPHKVRGSPAIYGLTVPTRARRPDLAWAFLRLLFSERGRALAAQRQLRVYVPTEMPLHGASPPELTAILGRP